MAKRLLIVIISLGILFGLIVSFHVVRAIFIKKYIGQMLTQAPTISTSLAKQETWNPALPSVGNLTAVNGVDVNSQVPGQIVKIAFQSGQETKKGDLLIQLDDSLDQQNLVTQQAQLKFAEEDYSRKKTLAARKVIAQSDLDQSATVLKQAEAAVASAQLNIDFKKIRAPFDGRLGISQVNLGQYIAAGQALVPLQQLDPLYVDFALPEQQLKFIALNQLIEVSIDAYPNQKFTGKITAINAKSDPNTHTISVRATVPNPKTQLYPGIFAQVSVVLPAEQAIVTVPQTAISYSLHGDSVFIVVKTKDQQGKPIQKVEQRFVTVGERRGDVAAILSGLQGGEEVVTSGQLKLQPGMVVNVNNSVELKE